MRWHPVHYPSTGTAHASIRLLAVWSPRTARLGLFDIGIGGEHALDLAQLDAETAHLDLVVAAPDELDAAVGQPAAKVAGLV